MRRKRKTIGAMARLWFAVAPQERAVLFGVLAVALIGLTARYLHQRAGVSIPMDPPDGEPAFRIEEPQP